MMLNLKQCKDILKETGKKYSDEQVLAIRDFFYKMARINVQYIKEKLSGNEQKSHIVHPGVNG
ncbi:MAG: hypothetical protein KKA07_08115 [Bacteroidetes bacterium]|nr:hypothetical protein [Bacteroidota bacterium]MBU1719025.1 hypothetical protein [Bacteroidota bacterium]